MRSNGQPRFLKLRFILLSLVAAGLIYLDSRDDLLQPVRSMLFAVARPLIEVAETPMVAKRWLSNALQDNELLRERNEELASENVVLLQRISDIEQDARTAQWLNDLLNAAERLPYETVKASLKRIGNYPQEQRIVIDLGSSDGVTVGQPVVDFRGVLGQVTEVTSNESAVTLITYPGHTTPVRVERTNLLTYVNGVGDSDSLIVPFVESDQDVVVGDVLIASGLGGRFPARIRVAEVTGVVQDRHQPFMFVTAKPYATVDYGYDVLVISLRDNASSDARSGLFMNESDTG